METSIKAVWQGNFKQGNGQFSVEDSKLNAVTFKPLFVKNNEGFTNPEQLLASAHASCFTMTLSHMLSENGFSADHLLETTVSVEVDHGLITKSSLTLMAKIPGITEEQFQLFALKAKESCPIGKILNVQVSLEASLAS